MLKLYLYGYFNQVQSSRRLERECARNLELIWLMGRLKPDFKTIADFRRNNGSAIREVSRQFVALCRDIDLLDASVVAIDGSKFKAVNAKARSFTRERLRRRLGEIDAEITRYDTRAHEERICVGMLGAPADPNSSDELVSASTITESSGKRKRTRLDSTPEAFTCRRNTKRNSRQLG